MQKLFLLSFPFTIVEIHLTNIERLLLPRTQEMWKGSIVWPSKNIFSYDCYSSVEHKRRCLADCSCCSFPYNSYTGAGHIIRISSKSWFISLIPFKKWNLYNVYIHSTQTDIFQVFISFNFDDYNWQLMKTPNSVSQKIRILLKTNTKKGFLEILANWKVWTWKVWACTALNT